jgi:hypothetical protein
MKGGKGVSEPGAKSQESNCSVGFVIVDWEDDGPGEGEIDALVDVVGEEPSVLA